MAWFALLVAGVLEVLWAYTMKQSHGFTNLKYSSITLVAMIAIFLAMVLTSALLEEEDVLAALFGRRHQRVAGLLGKRGHVTD